MIVGSLAGALCAGGGFCAGSDEIVEHQRINASAYTFSAALPAMLATTASETLALLQTDPSLLAGVRDNLRAMWAMLDPRSDWVRCTSAPENPTMLCVLKSEVVVGKRLGIEEQESLLQDVVDEVSCFGGFYAFSSFPSFLPFFPLFFSITSPFLSSLLFHPLFLSYLVPPSLAHLQNPNRQATSSKRPRTDRTTTVSRKRCAYLAPQDDDAPRGSKKQGVGATPCTQNLPDDRSLEKGD